MKMIYGSYVCELSVSDHFFFHSQVPCKYGRETIAYAVKHFFQHWEKIKRDCTRESWQMRLIKGRKPRRGRTFEYVVPAILLELPGEWVRLQGEIDSIGVKIKKVELLTEHPAFQEAV